MSKPYSRLASVEERKNVRSAVLFIVLSIAALVTLYFVGLPLLSKFTIFVSDFGKSNKPITKNNTTPPAPPQFNSFPDFTNQNKVTLSGTAEPGATVKLTFNGVEQDSLTDKNGAFSFDISLTAGTSTFSAIAVDSSGNTSQKSQDYSITFDNTPPNLSIDNPADGSSFFGAKQRQITIQGTSEPGVQVTINDRIISVDDNGKFQYSVTLNDGSNPFAVKATDQAGNTAEKDITLNFSN